MAGRTGYRSVARSGQVNESFAAESSAETSNYKKEFFQNPSPKKAIHEKRSVERERTKIQFMNITQ